MSYSMLLAATVRAKREILDAVFGEFRRDLFRVSRLVMDRRLDEAQELIEKIIDSMYNVQLNAAPLATGPRSHNNARGGARGLSEG